MFPIIVELFMEARVNVRERDREYRDKRVDLNILELCGKDQKEKVEGRFVALVEREQMHAANEARERESLNYEKSEDEKAF